MCNQSPVQLKRLSVIHHSASQCNVYFINIEFKDKSFQTKNNNYHRRLTVYIIILCHTINKIKR